jgi:hypothetical protein
VRLALPALRSGKDTEETFWYNPSKCLANKSLAQQRVVEDYEDPETEQITEVDNEGDHLDQLQISYQPMSSAPVLPPGRYDGPSLKNPINQREGWKKSQPSSSKGKERDVNMKNGTQTNYKDKSYQITSDA